MEDIKLDLNSETVNKVINEFGKPLYNDVAKPAINTSKGALGFCSQFIVSGIKPYMYSKIKECEYKIKEIDKQLEEKYNCIPDERKTEPRTNILGPAVDVLKYNLEEEHIKNFFVNLIGNDMDIVKQSKVLPSYIEVVKQLSKDDANFLKTLKEFSLLDIPIMKIKITYSEGGFIFPSNDIILIGNSCLRRIPAIIIDNLERQKIIETTFLTHRNDKNLYDTAFELCKEHNFLGIKTNETQTAGFSKGLLKITDFGKNFIDICLS